MSLKPITKSRMPEAADEQIKELILSQKKEPGSKLPSERELVSQLQISRTSVREALRVLEIMGLVEVKPGKGTYVKGLNGDLFSPLPIWLATHKETLHNQFEARLILEPAGAELAALRATPDDIQKLKEAWTIFKQKLAANDIVGLIIADIRFHSLIGAATGNKTIEMLTDTITRFLFDGWKATLRVEGRPQKTVLEHNKILQAIISKDAKAAKRAMSAHLENAVRNLKNAGLE